MEINNELYSQLEQFFNEIYYKELLKVARLYPKKRSVIVRYRDLEKFDIDLAKELIEHPDKIIKASEEVVSNLGIRTTTNEFKPHIRFYGIPNDVFLVEEIGSQYLNKLFSFRGLVTRRGELFHEVKKLTLQCTNCSEKFVVNINRDGHYMKKCPICKKGRLKEIYEESTFVDFQMLEVQDMLERVRAGAPSAKIVLLLEDDLVNSVVPGDNVEVTGILRINLEKRKGMKKTIFPRYVETVYIRKLRRDFEEIEITKEDEAEILRLAKMPNIEKKIIDSIAPDIYGNEEIKRAIAFVLFGGSKGKITPSKQVIRDNIHVLLIGDPGIAKTRFLTRAAQIAPKSIYVSGQSVSGVGLTASAEKDELSGGGWTLKAGALVLASGGIALIDEFDKISDEDRGALHEVMESGTISIAKAGIVSRFKANTSIIAAANPKFGRFQQNRNIAEQFNIPPSLLSRFDLIFSLIDKLDPKRDKELAEHILRIHKEAGENANQQKLEKTKDIIDTEMLRKYIAYARKNIRPVLSNEAIETIKEYYLSLRSLGQQTGTVPITPRYLEGLVRMAEANAKMRLSDIVEKRDALESVNIMDYVMKKIMVDQETGKIDVDIITTGKSQSAREKQITVYEIIRELSKEYEEIEIGKVIEEAKSVGIDEQTTKRTIEELERNGDIYRPRHGYIRLVPET